MRTERLLYCDFVDPNADPRVYQEVEDIDKLKLVVNDFLEEHNAESKSPMPLARVRVASNECARLASRRRRLRAISAPRSSERLKLGHDVPLIHSGEWRETHRAHAMRDPRLKGA